MKVVILHDNVGPDARPDELDVFVQVDAVSRALQALGHSAEAMPFSLDFPAARSNLERANPDVVFNLVEAVEGQGRLIYLAPALLDAMDIAYVGSRTVPMFVTSNKTLAKQVLAANGIDSPRWYSSEQLASGAKSQPARSSNSSPCDTTFVPSRYIIKSLWEEASVGLDDDSIIHADDPQTLFEAIDRRLDRLDGEAFAEAYIEGREFNLSVLAGEDREPEVLPPAEIDFVDYAADKPKFVSYKAKWDEKSFEYHHTPRRFSFPPSDDALLANISEIARKCWKSLHLQGWVRVDFRVDETGRPWVLEVNANPCLSPDAGFAAATQQAGLSLETVCRRILNDAVRPARPRLNRKSVTTIADERSWCAGARTGE